MKKVVMVLMMLVVMTMGGARTKDSYELGELRVTSVANSRIYVRRLDKQPWVNENDISSTFTYVVIDSSTPERKEILSAIMFAKANGKKVWFSGSQTQNSSEFFLADYIVVE